MRAKSTTEKGESGAKKCPECSSTVIVHSPDTGEVICNGCGLVLSEHLVDKRPEWRAFTLQEEADRSRVGGPVSILQVGKGLQTVISKIDRDASGREVPLSTRMQMLRLKKWQNRIQYEASIERNLSQALSELDRIADSLHIPEDIQEVAADIYRKALDKGLVRGRSIPAIVAASLYAAFRKTGKPRSLKEIAAVSRAGKKDIARCYRLLLDELPLKMPIPDPKIYVTKISSKAEIPEKTQLKAIEVIDQAGKSKAITGKDPIGLAAAALYIACIQTGVKKIQKEIADAAGVTEVTVRNRYKGLKNSLGLSL